MAAAKGDVRAAGGILIVRHSCARAPETKRANCGLLIPICVHWHRFRLKLFEFIPHFSAGHLSSISVTPEFFMFGEDAQPTADSKKWKFCSNKVIKLIQRIFPTVFVNFHNADCFYRLYNRTSLSLNSIVYS